jgi:hypothetical protein
MSTLKSYRYQNRKLKFSRLKFNVTEVKSFAFSLNFQIEMQSQKIFFLKFSHQLLFLPQCNQENEEETINNLEKHNIVIISLV